MDNPEPLISWFELPVSNMDRAKTFYETIFEIELHLLVLGKHFKMAIFPSEDSSIGGSLVWNEDAYKPSNTHGALLHLNANPDLQIVQDKIENAGGWVKIPKREIAPGKGFMAVFEDSEGNRVALHSDA